jgi:hypothetical protein
LPKFTISLVTESSTIAPDTSHLHLNRISLSIMAASILRRSARSNIRLPLSIPSSQLRLPRPSAFSTVSRQLQIPPPNSQEPQPFDTLSLQSRLEDSGLTPSQSHALLQILQSTLSSSLQSLTSTSLTREEAQRTLYQQRVDFASLRSELLSADASEASVTRSSHDRLANELDKLRSRLREEVARTQASVRLDLNLEKGRIREETGGMENAVREVETRIETEVARLREMVEQVKVSSMQWLIGVTTGIGAIVLGIWRLLA